MPPPAGLCQLLPLEEVDRPIDTVVYISHWVKIKSLQKSIQQATTPLLRRLFNETKVSLSSRIEPNHWKHYPESADTDPVHWFKSRNLTDGRRRSIGVAYLRNWMFDGVYKFIDAGGTYQMKNPIMAASEVPDVNSESARRFGLDEQLVKDVYRFSKYPRFIRDIADTFVGQLSRQRFIGLHWRFNPRDFYNSGEPPPLPTTAWEHRIVCI